MRGWSCKDAGPVLGISDTKVTQSLFSEGAAFDKVAKLMLANPLWTVVDLVVHMVRVSQRPGLAKPGELIETSARVVEARKNGTSIKGEEACRR